MLKGERRKVFHAMHSLPWILLAVVLAGIAFYFYRQSNQPLNVAPSLPLNITEIITTNIVKIIEVTNTIPREMVIPEYDPVLEFQVEAVSNKHAEWVVNVRGETSFKWLEVIEPTNPVPRNVHGISIYDREYPFTLYNLDAARDINLDIEAEIVKIVVANVEAEFIGRNNKDDIELKKKLQKNMSESIKRLFDGFETFNKENSRR